MRRRRRARTVAPWALPAPWPHETSVAVPIENHRREVVVVAARNVAGAFVRRYTPDRWRVQIIVAGFPRQPIVAIVDDPARAAFLAGEWTRWAVTAAAGAAPAATGATA